MRGPTPPPWYHRGHASAAGRSGTVGAGGWHEARQPHRTDTEPIPNLAGAHRIYRPLIPMGPRTDRRHIPSAAGRPWVLPLPLRLLLILIHLCANLTTRALAALFSTSQSTVDRVIHDWVSLTANAFRPDAHDPSCGPWIIYGNVMPVLSRSSRSVRTTRRSVHAQIVIRAQAGKVTVVGRRWPGNRNDVIVVRHNVAQLLDGSLEPRNPQTVTG
jgi:hypothetical protein